MPRHFHVPLSCAPRAAAQLAPGETLLIDSDSLVAFSDGINYDVKQVGNFVTCCLGGEGCFNTVLTGPGTIYLQSLSYEKLIRMLLKGAKQPPKKDADDLVSGGPPDGATMER